MFSSRTSGIDATVAAIGLGSGTAAIFAVVHSRFPGRDALLALFTALLLPGMTVAAALSFLASFDEVGISLFLVGPRPATLPIEVWHTIQYRADPQISALSKVLIALTALLVAAERSPGVQRAVGR